MYLNNPIFKSTSLFLSLLTAFNCFPADTVKSESVTIPCYSVDESQQYDISTIITASWDHHINIDLSITNIGDTKIDNWYLTFKSAYIIENIWNASIYETDGEQTYTIKNTSCNQDILPGESVTVGMTLAYEGDDKPNVSDWYFLNVSSELVDHENYSILYQEYSKSTTEYTGAILLSAIEDIEDWTLIIDSEYSISEASNAILTIDENGVCYFENNNLSNISAGSSVLISIQGQPTDKDFVILDSEVKSHTVAFRLKDDKNNNNILDYLEYVSQEASVNETFPIVTEMPVLTPIATVTNIEVSDPKTTITPKSDVTEIPTITPEPSDIPVPTVIPIDDIDTDGDGLTDGEEVELGTNIYKTDTDDDGLDDLIEIIIGYNPIKIDSDDNGISDDQEDFDNDGINNLDEIIIGTSLFAADTDFDDLSDKDELDLYGTDPLKFDTDCDEIDDGSEVMMGKNPSDDSDAERKVLQHKVLDFDENNSVISSIDVQLDLVDRIDYSLSIRDLHGETVGLESIPGCIGSPIEFKCYEDFDKATVTIHYDESMLGNMNEEDLGIYWYNEETGIPEDQNQAVVDSESNTITVELEHFSIYMLYNKSETITIEALPDYDTSAIEYHESLNLDMFIVLEDNVSVSDEERSEGIRIAKDLINNLSEKDRASVIIVHDQGLGDPSCTETTLYNCDNYGKKELSHFIENNYCQLNTEGQTVDALVNTIIYQSYVLTNKSGDIGNTRRIVQITNGKAAYCWDNPFYNNKFIKMDEHVPYYAINTSAVEINTNNWLWTWCNSTGGKFFAKDTWNIDRVLKDVREDELDKDGDGLYDFMEIAGMVAIGYDEPIKTKVNYDGTGIDSDSGYDSDGDGLSDGEEMGRMLSISVDEDSVVSLYLNDKLFFSTSDMSVLERFRVLLPYVPEPGKTSYVFCPLSDPNNPDTDGDKLSDDVDGFPCRKIGTVNVIVYGDDYEGETRIKESAILHRAYFREHNMELFYLHCNDHDEFVNILNNLAYYDVDDVDGISEHLNKPHKKIYYKGIDNFVIVSHGHYNGAECGGGISNSDSNWFDASLSLLVSVLDIQSCYSAYETKDNNMSCARNLMHHSTKTKYIYAWSGQASTIKYNDESTNTGVFTSALYKYYKENGIVEREKIGNYFIPIGSYYVNSEE